MCAPATGHRPYRPRAAVLCALPRSVLIAHLHAFESLGGAVSAGQTPISSPTAPLSNASTPCFSRPIPHLQPFSPPTHTRPRYYIGLTR